MAVLIYLDQNILSDLRDRKLHQINDSHLKLLKNVLLMSGIEVIYSNITLIEINQIPHDKYKMEHIDLLNELNAKYIDLPNEKLLHTKPSQIWKNYIDGVNSNSDDFLGMENIQVTFNNLSRKISGLPINNSFEDIGMSIDSFIQELPEKMQDLLNSIEVNEKDLQEPYKKYKKEIENMILLLKNNLPKTLREVELRGSELTKFNNFPLGPKPFREYESIKNLKIHDLPSSEVVSVIINELKKGNSSFAQWIDNLNKNLEDKISIAYNLMNWAGYYPDDFDKIKNKHDRFLSSTNDMNHAKMAARSSFLISNDNQFRMKAIAAYEYVGSKTIVCSSRDFIKKYCKLG